MAYSAQQQDAKQDANQDANDVTIKGVVGIQNMGNTCYCNSTLQLLRACSEWSVYCITNDFNTLENRQNSKAIILAYQDILKTLWSAYKPAYVRPLGFICEIQKAVRGTVYESFAFPMQHDSHEYLIYLLDQFHESLKIDKPYLEKDVIGDETDKMKIRAENAWNKYLSKNTSEIVRIFFGMMRKTIQCTNCNNKTYQWEIFNSIKVPCDGVTFYDWIRHEVNESSDIEGYKCDNCNGRYLAKKSSHIWKLPENLFITVHRFHHNGHKNMTHCPYNGQNISFKDFFAEESDDPLREAVYELRGVSDHHGTHMGGHYTAQFKHPISKEWWWFDDAQTHKINQPNFSSSNYIFFFSHEAIKHVIQTQ